MSTKVKIFRNLKDYKFSHKLSNEHRNEVVEKLKQALNSKMQLIDLSEIDEKTKNFIAKSNCANKTGLVFAHKTDNVSIELFDDEHMTIVAESENEDSSAYEKAFKIAHDLSNKIEFAFNDEYGYLMSNLNHIGTGIQIETDIMLISIKSIGKIEQVKQNLAKLGYTLKETKFRGMFKLETKCNLGISEKQIVSDYKNTLVKLHELEIESAKMLDVEKHDELLDLSNRSFAILENAHLMNYEELYTMAINLRIGQMLSMNEVSEHKLNKLQKLVMNKKEEFISQTEQKTLAQQVKEILKGE